MAGDTKERILETALALFAQNGYLGTSMTELAGQLGITKAALYKHYAGKQQLLEQIVARMNVMDEQRARAYAMPEPEQGESAEAYLQVPLERLRAYSAAQFDHWTRDPFSANFRRMLMLEQYRVPALGQLYQKYLAAGPLAYMAAVFRPLTDSEQTAMQLALEFYGPMYLLYSIYDGAENKETVAPLLDTHVERFIDRVGFGR